jgi:hypothetical protein
VEDAAPVARRRPWWLWPLLLLLLLIPLLFWFRSCSELPVVGLPADAPLEPPAVAVDEVVREPGELERRPVDTVPGADARTTQLPADQATDSATDPAASEDRAVPPELSEPEPEPEPQELVPPPPEPTQEEPPQAVPEEMLPEPPVPPEPPMSDMPPGVEPPQLTLPPDALRQGSVDFLNGQWSSNSGLIDETGRPVRLNYDFENGQGEVTLRRSDGTICRGQSRASIAEQRLVIADQGRIRCPDGQSFERSTVDCTVGAGGNAECNGRYESGSAFPVEIRQAE